MRLEGRTALVTGGASGIGAATARRLAAEGARVAVGDLNLDGAREVAAELDGFATELDVTDTASVGRAVAAVTDALGPVDVLVNNAGISVPGLLHEVDPAAVQREIAVNLVGPTLATRRAIRSLLARRAPGDLVFISSENAVKPRPYQPGYTASKWGIEGLARTLRVELDGTGIRSIIVRPGPTFPTDFAIDWDPALVKKLLATWQALGLQRHLRWMPASSVASAVVSAIATPPGTNIDVVSLSPEAPPELRLTGESE